jgi:hypothetical protein
MENLMSETTDTQTAPAEAPATQAPGLTIADLVMTAQIVQRGANAGLFKAEELKGIGDFYERLIKFLETSGAIVRAQPTAEETAPAPTGE